MYDLITLQGLFAHLRGEWFTRLALELRAGAERPDLALSMFDSHLCVAEYLLYGPTPYAEVLALAATLRESARRSGVLRAVAFATALRGEAALLSGDLALAEAELTEAAELHHDIGSTAGEAHSLQRLAEVRLAQGDRAEATEAAAPGAPAGALVGDRAAPAAAGIRDHDPSRAGRGQCPRRRRPGHGRPRPGGRLHLLQRHARRPRRCGLCRRRRPRRRAPHLAVAETSAALWRGTAWQAAIAEARAHLHRAEGDADAARRRLLEAAELFAAAGQPLDADRCLA